MALKCGIIGITNIGKTTIFNCISSSKAQSSNFAFSTSKTNIGVVNVPDQRLYEIDKLINAAKVVPATVEIADIPGLAKGSSKGEGLGNKFLGEIQQTDAIIHVLRCFEDENLPHVEGSIDPVRDLEIVDLELQVKDLEMVERRMLRVEKVANVGDKKAKKELDILNIYKDHFENFQSARTVPLSEEEKKIVDDLFLLSSKPVVFVCNVDDASASSGNKYVKQVQEALKGHDTEIIIIAGELEAEIAELDDEEDRKAFLEDAGLSEPGVNRMIRAAYHLLNLQSFFTAGPKEVHAWTIRTGMNAHQSAGVIHSDLERGFIRAEVMKYDDFINLGSEQACKDAGKLQVEGKNYIVEDGDIIYVRFNV